MEHLQEELYKQIKEEKGIVTIFLKSGVRIVGEVVAIIEIEGQDEEPVILQEENTVLVVTAPEELIDLTIPGVDQLPNTAAETASSPYEIVGFPPVQRL